MSNSDNMEMISSFMMSEAQNLPGQVFFPAPKLKLSLETELN